MGKRLISVLLCLCMLLPMCPRGLAEEIMEPEIPEEEFLEEAAFSSEDGIMASGEMENGVGWTLAEDGVLTISGTGEIPDFGDGSAPWAGRSEEILSVMIGEDVTGIGSFAFSGCEKMDTIWMGQAVQRIGEGAFRNCAALMEITLPEKLPIIEGNTFENCLSLSEINLPEGLSGIGSAAFAGCKGLTAIVLPAGVTTLENNTFQGCVGLRQVTLSQNLTRIGDSVFSDCENLEGVVLPNELKTIGASAFQNCGALKEITLPQSLTSIGSDAFRNCGSLGSIAFPDRVTEIPNGAFENCRSLAQVTLPGELVRIGDSAFRGCESLGQIEIPNSVAKIGAGAFYGCAGLKRVTLPENLEKIEEMLFSGCSALGDLVLPEVVTTIGYQAFFHCEKLKLAALPKAIQSIEATAFEGCGDLAFLDLSELPNTVDREIELKVVLPQVLSGMSVIWSVETLPGQKEARRIGSVQQEKGVFVPKSTGILRLVCWEPVTGIRNSREIQVQVGLEIRPVEERKLISGDHVQLILAESSSGEEQKAVWSLADGDDWAAEITQDGLLTAKPVEKLTQVTVIATASTGDKVQKTVTILPRATGLALLRDGVPVGREMRVDMAEETTFLLSAKVRPEDALSDVEWGSSDEQIAYVKDDGTVTLRRPGTVTLWAASTDGSNVLGTTELQVYYIDAAQELTLTCDKENLGPGETAWLRLNGEGPIAPEKALFFVADSEKATVDTDGKVTAGENPGKVMITAQLKDDPLLRVAQMELEIEEGEPQILRLMPVFLDDRGYLAEVACVEFGKLAGKAYTFQLAAQGSVGGDRWQEVEGAAYESSDIALAKVNANGTVTVQPKKEGICTLTARTPEGLEAQIELWVRDSSPRLENSKLTINSYETESISTGLVEIYGNTIEGVSLYDYDASKKAYKTEPSQSFAGTYEDGALWLEALDKVKNGNYSEKLLVQTANTSFEYLLQIKVANSLPKVNVKQIGKFELFYLDSRAGLSISAPGSEIKEVTLAGTKDFRLEETEDGWEIAYGEEYRPGTKAVTKGILQIRLEGYRVPAEKAISIATSNTVPKLTMDPAGSVMNPSLDPISRVRIFQGGQVLDLTDAEVNALSTIAKIDSWGEELHFTLTGAKGGAAGFTLRLPNWAQAVKLSHKIAVESKLPSLKLRSGTVKLNRRFYWQTGETAVYLTQSNQTLGSVTFASTAKEGTAQRIEADKIGLCFEPDGGIQVFIQNEQDLPKSGSYTFACKGSLTDGTELPAVNLKITVADTAPKAKLSVGSVRMNRYLTGREQATIAVTLSDPAYRVTGFRESYEELSYADGILTVCLTEESKNTSFLLTPIVEDVENGQTADLPNQLKLGLTVYDSFKLGVSLSAKGKLDTLVPESAITYTVSKLTNCQGTVENATLDKISAEQFRAELDTTGAKPVVRLMLREGKTYDTRQTYQVSLLFSVCGEEIKAPVQKVRVSQSALKVTVPKTLNLYLGQKAPLRCTLAPAAPVEKVALSEKTDKTFLEALGGMDNFEVNGNQVLFRMASPGKLKAGKSYAVYLDVTPEHNAVDKKPTQVKLTVKAVK